MYSNIHLHSYVKYVPISGTLFHAFFYSPHTSLFPAPAALVSSLLSGTGAAAWAGGVVPAVHPTQTSRSQQPRLQMEPLLSFSVTARGVAE